MRKIILELNEFNDELIRSYRHKHANIDKVISFPKIKAAIPDSYDSDFLEPWSQWVSIHTGVSCETHNIKHLGDSSKLEFEELWSQDFQSFGVVWGCLNSNPPATDQVKYFPDPWSTSSSTNMARYKNLQDFMRLTVQDRGSTALKKLNFFLSLAKKGVQLLPLLLRHTDFFILNKIFGLQYFSKHNVSSIYSILEYYNFKMFIAESEELESDKIVDVFFCNMLAHCQHYYWQTPSHHRIDFCMDLIDKMLEPLLQKYDQVAVINGLSQEYSGNLETWNSLYPKIGWDKFVKTFIDPNAVVEPCMSYDTNIIFESLEIREEAITKIEEMILPQNSNKLFFYERTSGDHRRLFLRLAYTGPLDCTVILNGKTQDLGLHFNILATRTGRHVQECIAYVNYSVDRPGEYSYNWELSALYG